VGGASAGRCCCCWRMGYVDAKAASRSPEQMEEGGEKKVSGGNWCVRFTRCMKERGDAADRKRREGCSALERGYEGSL
jgi:hypothetical protein